MATRDTIVIGASAGGVQALSALVKALPRDLPAAVFIVLHIPADVPSVLPEILARDSALRVTHAKHGEPSMPMSVLRSITVDYSLPVREIGPLLETLSRQTVADERGYPVPEDVEIEAGIAGQEMDAGELIASVEKLGRPVIDDKQTQRVS